MLFNSVHYLLFLPVAALIYFLLPKKIKLGWLLAASLFFYGCWKIEYLALIVLSILVTYACGRLIAARRDKHPAADDSPDRAARWILIASLLLNLGILFFFKYFNFMAATINALARAEAVPLLDILLPVGISFYTFQAIGYTIDVYRGTIAAERNLICYAVFISFFPQLVAGPIERAKNLLPQFLDLNRFDFSEAHKGLVQIIWGFFCKLVIADRLAMFVNPIFADYTNQPGYLLAVAAILFTFQIYCDFSSYSSIAIGSARIMGFKLMRNFNAPFLALSISDFWGRWHISLSTWLGDYVFTPLTWSRWANKLIFGKDDDRKPIVAVNYLIVFLISGIWHGANWTFVLWGLLHGLYNVASLFTKKLRGRVVKGLHINKKNWIYKALCRVWIFLLVVFAHIFFRAPSVGAAFDIVGKIFGQLQLRGFSLSGLFAGGAGDRADFVVALIAIAVLIAVDVLSQRHDLIERLTSRPLALRWAVYIVGLLIVLIFGIYGPQYDAAPFIYFQF